MSKKGIVLLNLGSPDSPTPEALQRYLAEFLMDKRVLDIPYLFRYFLVFRRIIPKRARYSAENYARIWTQKGSPLIHHTRTVAEKLEYEAGCPVFWAMRYGSPSVFSVLSEIQLHHRYAITELVVIPMYPHYAMASYETAVVSIKDTLKQLKWEIPLRIIPPFYNHPNYISALASSARPYLKEEFDHLLVSYHGVPERHLRKTDPTRKHCLQKTNCCETSSSAHATCYRHHVIQTTEALTKACQIDKTRYTMAFQSRFGKAPWIRPFTDEKIIELAQNGVKKLLVICPGFVSDCLETLEEIAIRGKELFLENGGSEFHLIPCLNGHPKWIEALKILIEEA